MNDILTLLEIVAGFVLLCLLYNAFWAIVERVHPLVYCKVPRNELHSHVHEFFRRGMDKAQMVITCEHHRREIRLRKNYSLRRRDLKQQWRCSATEDRLWFVRRLPQLPARQRERHCQGQGVGQQGNGQVIAQLVYLLVGF